MKIKTTFSIFSRILLLTLLFVCSVSNAFAAGPNTQNKWYKIRSSKGYFNSDQVTVEKYIKFQNSTDPTSYSGIWCFEETGTVAQNGGVNVRIHNARYYEEQVLAVGGNLSGNGNSARAQMFVPEAITSGYYAELEKRERGINQVALRINYNSNSNSYLNASNAAPNCLSVWNSASGLSDANGQFYLTEVPNMGENVRIVFNVPAGVTIKYNTQCESASFRSGKDDILDVMMNGKETFNFHNMPFLSSLFTAEGLDASKALNVTFIENEQTLIFATGNADSNVMQFSGAPVNGQWAADTQWFTWRSNRNNISAEWQYKYLTTSAQGMRDDKSMYIRDLGRDALPTDRGGLWCFVGTIDNFRIYNAAYGPDFCFARLSNGKYTMVPVDNIPAGAVVDFSSPAISNIKEGASIAYQIRVGIDGNTFMHINNNDMTTYGNYPGDSGNSFMFTSANGLYAYYSAFDVYQIVWMGASSVSGTIIYNETANVFGKRSSANHGDYIILKSGITVSKENFAVSLSDADYELESVASKNVSGHGFKVLNLNIKDKKATEAWTVHVTEGYTVNHAGNIYNDSEIFYLRPDASPKHADFSINGTVNKFVWGPVIKTLTQTVTYEVRDLATELTTGWYQLQIADNEVANLRDKIKTEEGNINTKANTLYLASAVYEPGAVNGTPRILKVTGVPQYAGEASTYVYITKNVGINSYSLISQSTGEKLTGSFSFNNGVLTKSGSWSYESSAHPLEGPYLQAIGSESPSFKVAKADLSEYKIYQVTIQEGEEVASDVRLSISNNDVLGSKVVANGGFIFMRKDSNAPLASHFSAISRNVVVKSISIGDETEGVWPITIQVATKQTWWTAYITGSARTDADRIIFNGRNFKTTEGMPLPEGYVPTALDFKTNVEDRFVWGPVIDMKNQTVTFDIRPLPASSTEITEGWYQIQLLGEDKITSVNTRIAANNGNINTRSNYIYVLPLYNNTSNSVLAKYGGIPAYADEPSSYFHITRSGNNITIQTPDGLYLKNGSAESGSTTPQNIDRWQYNGQKFQTAGWTAPGFWGGSTSVGGNAGNQGPIVATGDQNNYYQEHYITKVDIDSKYDVYQVDLSSTSQNKVKYVGKENLGNTEVLNHGYFFLTKGTVPTKENFRFEGNVTISAIAISGSKVITFTIETPTYNKEIIHRQAKYYDMLEVDSDKPNHGFIKEGEGWNVRTGSNGMTIREQNVAVFEIPIYLKQGDTNAFTSYLPTNQLGNYQRWYNWDTDGLVSDNVLISPSRSSVSENNRYNNGHLSTGDNLKPSFKLPVGIDNYNVGLDISRLTDGQTYNSGALTGCRVEPTLGMRVVYQIRDAKLMAKDIKQKTNDGEFLEVHNIAFPNVKHGTYEDKTISNLLPLDLDLNNYWIFDGNGETDNDLLQLTENGSLQMIVEMESGNTAPLRYVMKIPKDISQESGNINYSSFNTGHFILFQYPEGGVVPAGSKATINVYLQKTGGNQKYNLAQFNLTFIGNSEPVPVTELNGSFRHPNALADEFGAPVAELTFDNEENEEYAGHYRYPLNFKGVSYAFGNMQGRSWFASRGEYALRREAQTSGGIVNIYYPVSNYLRNMGDANAALGATKESDNYFLYIDAADQPGKVASIELEDALCAGSRLYCYGYIGCTSGGTQFYGTTNQNPTSILINVMGIDKNTGEEVLIYSYCPGIISSRGYDKNGRTVWSSALGRGTVYENHSGDNNYWALWQQVGFSFAIDAHTASQMSSYSVQIVNNAYNSEGADTVLDDFALFVKKPGAEVANTTPLCSDQIRHIKVITEYETLLEATGEDSNHDGMMNVGFCFLDKEVYDRVLAENDDKDKEHGYSSTNPENKYNKAFGEALMGNRTLDKSNKDHAFHNFNIIRDGEISTIGGETKQHFYTDIPQYSFKESMDDMVYRDSIRGERYIVFKESVAHGEASGIDNHKWTAGKSYYLLFSSAAITEEHVNNHDLGCTVFGLDDDQCHVLHEFTVAPPVIIKGDATHITSGDEVQACDGQVGTLAVDLNGRTETKDVIIKNLTYDWWTGYVSHKTMEMENDVPRDYDSNGHAIYDQNEPDKTFNTMPATLLNYRNVWWGTYKQRNEHLDKNAGEKIYLKDALLEFRRAYPNATDLVGVKPIHKSGDTVEYELTQDMIDCIAHFLQTEPESGNTPLILAKKEVNLALTTDKADEESVYHFVVIPIAPNIYSVDEDAIYCPDPQELKVKITSKAPSLANGFKDMHYPETMHNVPIRVGLQQLNAVRHRSEGTQNTLAVPLRNAKFAYPEIGKTLQKTSDDAVFWMVGTDDPAYKSHDKIEQDFQDNYVSADEDLDEMLVVAGLVEELAVTPTQDDPSMKIIFNSNMIFREGYTYTMKVKYHEMKDANGTRDDACEGSFVFDMKVVPEYQSWTGIVNNDWTNDQNWARADRAELLAGKEATGSKIAGATALDDADSYVSNEENTTANSFVPMYFTNVLIKENDGTAVELYKDGFVAPVKGTSFLGGLKGTATKDIVYDLSVTPVNATDRTSFNYDCDFKCELFDTYIANGVTFAPGAQMGNTHYLIYNKAWVEYELNADRWYTLGSPLKKSVAGDWYSPTAGGKQLTPHFYEINYKPELNDRFRPAYYQRSWDREGNNKVYMKSGGEYDSFVKADWSNVYNDATVDYSKGGFSVKAELDYMDDADRPVDYKVLVRLPKADEKYTYYAVDGSTGQAADAQIGSRNDSYRLLSDALKSSDSFSMEVRNATDDNNFLLLHNPFMAAMDMDAFFNENPDLEQKYWIVDADKQMVSVKTAEGWITTSAADGKYVAPLQGFFVKKASGNSITAKYTSAMQKVINPDPAQNVPTLRTRAVDTGADMIRLIAERDGASSTAVIMLGDGFSDGYVAGEDCETFVDGNLYDKPTVYTSAGSMAQTINVRKSLEMVPVGMISSDDSEVVLRFDLSESSYRTLYLYDGESNSFSEINDGAEVVMSGNNAGRYYLASIMSFEQLDAVDGGSQKGVWTLSGNYCGDSVDGLQPGLYIVDGVKMLIRK